MNRRKGALRGAMLMLALLLLPGGALPTVAQDDLTDSVDGAGLLGLRGGGAVLAV